MTRYLLLLGSNVDREHSLPQMRQLLAQHYEIDAVSRVCDCDAVGAPGSPRFYNQALWIRSNEPSATLRDTLRSLEAKLGRVRTENRNEPRTIDVDILLAIDPDGQTQCEASAASELVNQHHVCRPAAEIAGDVYLAELGMTIRDARDRLPAPPSGFTFLPEVAQS